MGKRPREKPENLAAKLLQIRQYLGLSQSQLIERLGGRIRCSRISEFEHGIREPSLLVVLAYAKTARVNVEVLIDDKRELPERFRGSPRAS